MSVLDSQYFAKKLQLVLRDVQQYTSEEMALELYRLASTANPTIQSARINELGVQLSASQAREAELRERLESEIAAHAATIKREAKLSLKMEAAAARIKASQEQEPDAWISDAEKLRVEAGYYEAYCHGRQSEIHNNPMWFKAPIPPELAELQRENAELRKLLEAKVPEGKKVVECWGCEGKPSGNNNPCEVCGAHAQPPKEPKQ